MHNRYPDIKLNVWFSLRLTRCLDLTAFFLDWGPPLLRTELGTIVGFECYWKSMTAEDFLNGVDDSTIVIINQ